MSIKIVYVLVFLSLLAVCFSKAADWKEVGLGLLSIGNIPVQRGEDANGNGTLDPGEDWDSDGHLDVNEYLPPAIDTNGDGVADAWEDTNGDGRVDVRDRLARRRRRWRVGRRQRGKRFCRLVARPSPAADPTQHDWNACRHGGDLRTGRADQHCSQRLHTRPRMGNGQARRLHSEHRGAEAIPAVARRHGVRHYSRFGQPLPTLVPALCSPDQLVVWMPACFIGIVLPSMLSLIFLKRGTEAASEWEVPGMTAEGVADAVTRVSQSEAFGTLFWYFTMFCGLIILWPSTTTTADGVLRRWVDVFWTGSAWLRRWKTDSIGWLYFAVLCDLHGFRHGHTVVWPSDNALTDRGDDLQLCVGHQLLPRPGSKSDTSAERTSTQLVHTRWFGLIRILFLLLAIVTTLQKLGIFG